MKKPLSIPTPTSLSALGALPAKTILVLLRDSTKPLEKAFGIERVEQDKENGTQEFMDGMEGKLAHEVKQKLGEKLFKVVKGTGVKGAVSFFLLFFRFDVSLPVIVRISSSNICLLSPAKDNYSVTGFGRVNISCSFDSLSDYPAGESDSSIFSSYQVVPLVSSSIFFKNI